MFIQRCRTGNCKPRLREWDSNPRHSAYETDNLTTDISRIDKYIISRLHRMYIGNINFRVTVMLEHLTRRTQPAESPHKVAALLAHALYLLA